MKFSIQKEFGEKEVELRLYDNDGQVCVVGRYGQWEKTLIIFRDGKFYRCPNAYIPGIDFDAFNKIKEEE